jgi:hypothetical protein
MWMCVCGVCVVCVCCVLCVCMCCVQFVCVVHIPIPIIGLDTDLVDSIFLVYWFSLLSSLRHLTDLGLRDDSYYDQYKFVFPVP